MGCLVLDKVTKNFSIVTDSSIGICCGGGCYCYLVAWVSYAFDMCYSLVSLEADGKAVKSARYLLGSKPVNENGRERDQAGGTVRLACPPG